MVFSYGDLYPGFGRPSNRDLTALESYDQQEVSDSEVETPVPTSDLSQSNVTMAILILVAAVWLFHL